MRIFVLIFINIILLAAGCHGGSGEVPDSAFEIDETFERGPLTVRLALDRKEITLADTVRLVIDARCETGYRAELPALGAELGEFGIQDYGFEPPLLEDDGTVLNRHWYVLEPFLSGDYEIPAVTVKFFKEESLPSEGEGEVPSGQEKDKVGQAGEEAAAADAEQETYELATEPQTVKVTSLVGEAREKLVLRDIKGATPIPAPGWREILPIAGPAALILAGAVAGIIIFMRRRRARPAPPVPAHEIAYLSLEKLIAEQLIEEGRIKEFYFRVTAIIRTYIENRFGLHAPEETTEEFLADLAGSDALQERNKGLLAQFLEHCDLVKFAKYGPSQEEIQGVFNTTKAFIEETKAEQSVTSMGRS